MSPTLRREPVPLPAPPPCPLDTVLARLSRQGILVTRSSVLRAALDAGHDPEFAAYLARRAGGADDGA